MGLASESGSGLEKGIGWMIVKQKQQQPRRKETEPNILVTPDRLLLQTLLFVRKVHEIHTVQSELEERSWETNPIGPESEPGVQLPV